MQCKKFLGVILSLSLVIIWAEFSPTVLYVQAVDIQNSSDTKSNKAISTEDSDNPNSESSKTDLWNHFSFGDYPVGNFESSSNRNFIKLLAYKNKNLNVSNSHFPKFSESETHDNCYIDDSEEIIPFPQKDENLSHLVAKFCMSSTSNDNVMVTQSVSSSCLNSENLLNTDKILFDSKLGESTTNNTTSVNNESNNLYDSELNFLSFGLSSDYISVIDDSLDHCIYSGLESFTPASDSL